MKQLIFLLTLLTGLSQSVISQETDSLLLENSEYIKKRLNLLLYRLNEMEQTTSSEFDSLQGLSSSSLKKMDRIGHQNRQRHQSMQDTLKNRSNQLQDSLFDIHRQIKRSSLLHLVLFGMVIALILLLLFFYVKERRKSIDRLIRRTDRIAGQNDRILEKAGELKALRDELEKNIKQQKKLRKKIKKKKK